MTEHTRRGLKKGHQWLMSSHSSKLVSYWAAVLGEWGEGVREAVSLSCQGDDVASW